MEQNPVKTERKNGYGRNPSPTLSMVSAITAHLSCHTYVCGQDHCQTKTNMKKNANKCFNEYKQNNGYKQKLLQNNKNNSYTQFMAKTTDIVVL
jgi:hypothetical protein